MRKVFIGLTAAATLAAGGVAHAQMPAPADLIKAWDKNGDGVVDKDEWVAAGRKAERFDLVDANHDGKVTAEELQAAMEKMRQQRGG
jgi:Ni/Co efflux regulator RcnB